MLKPLREVTLGFPALRRNIGTIRINQVLLLFFLFLKVFTVITCVSAQEAKLFRPEKMPFENTVAILPAQESENAVFRNGVRQGYVAILLTLQFSAAQREVNVGEEVAKELTAEAVRQVKSKELDSLIVWQNRTKQAIGIASEKRLLEIYIQREGFRSVLNPYFAQLIDVTPARFDLLNKSVAEKANAASMVAQNAMKDSGVESSIKRALVINDAVTETIESVLSEQEIERIRSLHGRPFSMPERMKKLGSRSVLENKNTPISN